MGKVISDKDLEALLDRSDLLGKRQRHAAARHHGSHLEMIDVSRGGFHLSHLSA